MKTMIQKTFVVACLMTLLGWLTGCATAATNDIAGVGETNLMKLSERSAKILLEVVSEDQDSTLALLVKIMAQYDKRTPTKEVVWHMMPLLGSGTNVTKVSIRDIIKKYGEPTTRATMPSKPKDPAAKPIDLDVYNFDNGAFLTCLKGSDDIYGLLEPNVWFMIGIRKKAQEALAEVK